MSEGSPLSRWAFGVLRPVVRLLRAAGLTEEAIHAQVNRALVLHRQDMVRGRVDAPMSQERLRALGNLLAAWSRTPAWAGADGMPRDLELADGASSGFAALVATHLPGVSAAEALSPLERFGAVARTADGSRVRLLSGALVYTSQEGFAVEPLLTDLRRFAQTLEYNVFEKLASGPGRFQASTLRSNIDPARAAEFERYVRRAGGAMLTAADDELSRHENAEVAHPESFGIGVFMFSDEPDPDDDGTKT